MNRSARWSRRVGVLLLVVAAGATARADNPVNSRWRTDDLRIDGVMNDWPSQTFVSKEVSTSVMNDDKDLYVLVATSDAAVILQLRRAGLVVYLDPKGGKGQTFGVRIPPLGSRLDPANIPLEGQATLPILSYFDVVGPGSEDLRRVEVGDATDIDLRVGSVEGTFFLELKVPRIDPTRSEVGLGIVTPEPPRVARPRGRGGRGMPGGAGAPGEPEGKEIEIWTKVLLATGRV